MRSLTVIAAVGLVLSPAAACVVWAQGYRNIPASPPASERYAANLGIYYRPVFSPNGEFGARLTRPPVDGSPAAQLQLEPGDTIFALDGIRFRTPADVLNHRAQTRVDFVNVRTNAPQSSIVNLP